MDRHRCAETIRRQAELLREAVRPHLRHGERFALLDFPDHSNVGDSAIWLGELALLRELTGQRPTYVCTKDNPDWKALEQAVPTGPILLHGGGNFGDIWMDHHRFREAVLARFPRRRIIQLPQSIHFSDQRTLRTTAEKIAVQGNFTLFVRDSAGFAFARQHFDCPIVLAPDAAFALGPMERTGPVRDEVLCLMRTDVEKRGVAHHLAGFPVVDWLDEPAGLRQSLRPRAAMRSIMRGEWHKSALRERLYEALAQHRVSRGVKLLSQGQRIVTDRLHGHILCVLLDIPHVALDNVTGKIAGYVETWTLDCPVATHVTSVHAVSGVLNRLRAAA